MFLILVPILLITNIFTISYTQFSPSLINPIQTGQGQNREASNSMTFNPYSHNDPISQGNNYFPQFSPNTPFMSQESLMGDSEEPKEMNYFQIPYTKESQRKDEDIKEKKLQPDIDKSMLENTFKKENPIYSSPIENKNYQKNSEGFFPYEFEKKRENITMETTTLSSTTQLPYKPLFPIFNKSNSNNNLTDKEVFPVPSKFSPLAGPFYEEDTKKEGENMLDKNYIKKISPTIEKPLINNIKKPYIKDNIEEINKENIPINKQMPIERNNLKQDKNGIPGFPPFPFMPNFVNQNNNKNKDEAINPFNGIGSGQHGFPNFPGFNFGIGNNNFFDNLPQIPKFNIPNMPSNGNVKPLPT